jgi:F-type H+-transporting ATPase subunit b
MFYLRFALLAVTLLSVLPTTFPAASAADEVASTAAHDNSVMEGEGHGDESMPPILSFDPGAAIANLAIFLGVFAILAKFVWPVILGGLTARENKIASDLESAQQANVKAEAKLSEYESKVQQVASEAQGILSEARRDAEANAVKIIDEAKADAKRQAERALADIETAKKVALADIANQTSAIAMGVAKQVVGRELKAEDHAELIRKALDQVPSKN